MDTDYDELLKQGKAGLPLPSIFNINPPIGRDKIDKIDKIEGPEDAPSSAPRAASSSAARVANEGPDEDDSDNNRAAAISPEDMKDAVILPNYLEEIIKKIEEKGDDDDDVKRRLEKIEKDFNTKRVYFNKSDLDNPEIMRSWYKYSNIITNSENSRLYLAKPGVYTGKDSIGNLEEDELISSRSIYHYLQGKVCSTDGNDKCWEQEDLPLAKKKFFGFGSSAVTNQAYQKFMDNMEEMKKEAKDEDAPLDAPANPEIFDWGEGDRDNLG